MVATSFDVCPKILYSKDVALFLWDDINALMVENCDFAGAVLHSWVESIEGCYYVIHIDKLADVF